MRSLGVVLTYILRHKPDAIGIDIDREGWVTSEELVLKCTRLNSFAELENEVATDDKGRFEFSPDKSLVRCVQGHSCPVVDLTMVRSEPPHVLFHGTQSSNIESILATGINSGQRHYVHLSDDYITAENVGARRKNLPACKSTSRVLYVDAYSLYGSGQIFYRSNNGVWLTENIHPDYIYTAIEDIKRGYH